MEDDDGGGDAGGGDGGGGEGVGLQGLSHASHIVHAIWYLDEVVAIGLAIACRDMIKMRRESIGSVANARVLLSIFERR